jgi:hypothetical protein
MLREVRAEIFDECDARDRIDIQRGSFHDQPSHLWMKEMKSDWSLLKRFDDYCLLQKALVEFNTIPKRSRLIAY